MLAQAIIVGTSIVPAGFGDFPHMRAFYRASHYGMKNSVGYLLRHNINSVLPQLENLFDDQQLTFSQWTVLMALREWGESQAGELARRICHDAGSLTRMLDQLEDRGLIARARSEIDRRVVSLSLTARGRAMVEMLLPRVVDFWNGLLGDFSHAEIRQLLGLLTRLAVAAEGKRDEQTAHHRHRFRGPERARRIHS
jgi:DNA-binding MarR family transcriptional regulator